MTASAQLDSVLRAIDEQNQADPAELTFRGETGPKELLLGRRVHEWVMVLDPEATAEQQVAARAHHLRRFTRPRSDYPEGRAGYLRWRADAKKAHAAEVATLLDAAGFSEEFAERVGQIIRKESLGPKGSSDPAVQTHEDAICLAFLETGIDEFVDQVGDEAAVTVLAKTAAKMSPAALGRLGEISFSNRVSALLAQL